MTCNYRPYAIGVPRAQQNFFGVVLLVTKEFGVFRFHRPQGANCACIVCAMLLRENLKNPMGEIQCVFEEEMQFT